MPSNPTIARTCEQCGDEFLATPQDVARGWGRFCSSRCRAVGIHESRANRFWVKVDRSGDCWLWRGSKGSDGYGILQTGGLKQRAHRVSYELTYGPIAEEACVLHRCDTPLCVRPDHLFLGTRPENMADKVQKGRQSRGEELAQARFTAEQVREIRRCYAAGGVSQRALARTYNVCPESIRAIVRRRNWKHIE
jgi:endogenous inhibitor of DNA gyrase (YacG/DUF329 family)